MGLFEHLAADDSDRIRTSRKAVAVAKKRADARFLAFVSNALTPAEREQRVSLIEDELAEVVAAVCEECDHDDVTSVYASIKENLVAKGGFCDDCRKWKSGPKAGCTCGEEPSSSSNSEEDDDGSGIATIDEPAGESAVGASEEDRESKVASDATGLSDKPSGPAIIKRKWKPNALNDEGNLAPLAEAHGEQQDVTEPADHSKDPLKDNQSLEGVDDLGKEQKGPHTDTWSGKGGQADPVTKEAMYGPEDVLPPHELDGQRPDKLVPAPFQPGGMIGEQPCENCGQPFPFNPNAPVCPNCAPEFQRQYEEQGHPGDDYGDGFPDPGIREGAVDPDLNPVAELLENGFDGFVPQSVVEAAIKQAGPQIPADPNAPAGGQGPQIPADPYAAPAGVPTVVHPAGFHNDVHGALQEIEGQAPGLTVNGQPYAQVGDQWCQATMAGQRPYGDQVEVAHPKPILAKVASAVISKGHRGPLDKFKQMLAERQQQGGAPAPAPQAPPVA